MSDLKTIHSLADIPDFASEKEEAEFWDAHELAPGLYTAEARQQAEQMLPPAVPRPGKTRPTSIRLGRDLESRLRHLAELKGTSYQTLLKEFVLERVYEEEKRLKVL